MTSLFSHSKVRVFLGVSALLGGGGIVAQALGVFACFDNALLGGYGMALTSNLFLDAGVLLLWAVVPGLLLLALGLGAGIMLTVALWGGYLALAAWAGQPYGVALPLGAAGMLTLLSVARALDWRGTLLDRERDDLNLLFGGFLPPHTLEQLQRQPDQINPAGVKKTVTILFADIRGFTSLTETLSPEQLLDMLHTYFRFMVPIVQKHGGTVNKLIGDSLMAFFGDPLPSDDHAERAALAALEMQHAMDAITQEWRAYGIDSLKIGIGLNTGPVVVGDIGSESVHAYTVLGRHVNVASQIETDCPDGAIYLSNRTYQQIHSRFACELVGERPYRHLESPMPIYRLMNRSV